MLSPPELAAWLRLTESVGPAAARRLLAMAGSAEAVFELPAAALDQALPPKQREAFNRPPEHLAELIPEDTLKALPPENAAMITGKHFFPDLISKPFMHGLTFAFSFSLILYLLAAVASWLGGGRFVHDETVAPARVPAPGE